MTDFFVDRHCKVWNEVKRSLRLTVKWRKVLLKQKKFCTIKLLITGFIIYADFQALGNDTCVQGKQHSWHTNFRVFSRLKITYLVWKPTYSITQCHHLQ